MDDNRQRFWRFSEDLARAGVAVLLPQYRVWRLHHVTPSIGVEDVLAGLHFAAELCGEYAGGRKVYWGGASAGGHLVLCAALLSPFRQRAGGAPDGIVLFNPVCCTHSISPWVRAQCGMEFDFSGLCPLHDMQEAGPPILAMHGTADEIAPFQDLSAFAEKYGKLGGSCEVLPFEGRNHGFHHPDAGEEDYQETLHRTLQYLKEGAMT